MTASTFGPLVDGQWLAEHRDDVRVVDVRWYLGGPPGRDAYLAGHIPGAVFLDVDTELSEPATTADGRHPLATPERFAAALGRAGIGAGVPVVAYDDRGGSIAARLWWMLHVLGEPVAVLDGGLTAWGGELTSDVPAYSPVERAARAWPAGAFVDAEAVATGDAVLLDARTAERYAHGDPAFDPRPGHIPGAVSAPWAQNLDPESGRFLSSERLRERYAALIGDRRVVAYCGSGVTACHDLLALAVAGDREGALYPGSWSQWANDPSRPAEPGADRQP